MQDLMRLFWFIFADPHWLVGSLLGWPVMSQSLCLH